MLYEVSRRSIALNKYEEPSMSWNNSILTVRRNKFISLFDCAYDFNSMEKKINCNELLVECSNGNPVSAKFLQSYIKESVDNMKLVKMVTDPYLRPYNNLLMEETASIASHEWSPDSIIMNHQKILAILTHTGRVDFFAFKRCGWTQILNFSKSIKTYLNFPDTYYKTLGEFHDVKEILWKFVTTAIYWVPDLNVDDSCYFVTAQKSGDILFWNVKGKDEVQCQICGSFKSSIAQIEVMTWVPISVNESLLVCSNVLGQVIGYRVNITNGEIQLNGEVAIWPSEDGMVVKYIQYKKYEDKLVIICNKYRNILVQLYDKDFKLLSQVINQVNGYKITSIINSCHGFYLATVNTKIYKLNIEIKGNSVDLSLYLLQMKDMYQSYELYGIGLSHNGALMAAVVVDRGVLVRKTLMKINVIFLSFESLFENETDMLISNPTKNLNQMWDLIELWRCKIFKNKNIPNIDYNRLLFEGNCDIYKLKLYYAFLKMYTNLKESRIVNLSIVIPETSLEKVRDQIFCMHACKLLCTLYENQQKEKLNHFQIECYVGTLTYIEKYCKKYDKDITEFVTEEILYQNVPNLKYECQCCDNTLEGFSCKLGHLNMFCSLTFTPINSDYLICRCGLLARLELYEQRPSCVLCDSYFQLFENTLS